MARRMEINPQLLEKIMIEAAKQAAEKTLPLFRSKIIIENKLSSGFDPVTQADKEAEEAIRAIIENNFPNHSIFGEELEDKIANSSYSWIIDPIDGTRAFISGLPVWGTLIGLFEGDKAIAGLMSQPHIGEIFLAQNNITKFFHNGTSTIIRSRETKFLQDAIMFTTTPALFSTIEQKRAYEAVEKRVKLARYGVDCYAYALLAMGQIDLVIEAGLKSCDIAPLIAIIEGAGGVISTWEKENAKMGGNIIAAATPQLRDEALEILHEYL